MQVSFKSELQSRGLYLISKWCELTCRVSVNNIEIYQQLKDEGKSVLWTSWHGNSHMMTRFFHEYGRDRKVMVMTPDDWRGEVLFAWLSRVGFVPRPMNVDDRGTETARKFAKLVRDLEKEGADNFIAPDGPAGPAHLAQ